MQSRSIIVVIFWIFSLNSMDFPAHHDKTQHHETTMIEGRLLRGQPIIYHEKVHYNGYHTFYLKNINGLSVQVAHFTDAISVDPKRFIARNDTAKQVQFLDVSSKKVVPIDIDISTPLDIRTVIGPWGASLWNGNLIVGYIKETYSCSAPLNISHIKPYDLRHRISEGSPTLHLKSTLMVKSVCPTAGWFMVPIDLPLHRLPINTRAQSYPHRLHFSPDSDGIAIENQYGSFVYSFSDGCFLELRHEDIHEYPISGSSAHWMESNYLRFMAYGKSFLKIVDYIKDRGTWHQTGAQNVYLDADENLTLNQISDFETSDGILQATLNDKGDIVQLLSVGLCRRAVGWDIERQQSLNINYAPAPADGETQEKYDFQLVDRGKPFSVGMVSFFESNDGSKKICLPMRHGNNYYVKILSYDPEQWSENILHEQPTALPENS
jgi:hypothetical protein